MASTRENTSSAGPLHPTQMKSYYEGEQDEYTGEAPRSKSCGGPIRSLFSRKRNKSNKENNDRSSLKNNSDHDRRSSEMNSFHELTAAQSNLDYSDTKLIRTASGMSQNDRSQPGEKRGARIFYSAMKKADNEKGYVISKPESTDEDEKNEEDALEAIAGRRAVMKDSWDFYRMLCSVMRDRRKYDHVFRQMQLDSVYPYMNSMTGLKDSGVTTKNEKGHYYDNPDKELTQIDRPEYASMSRTQVIKDLVATAEAVKPKLIQVVKALAGDLGLKEVGVGPVKEARAALRKAEQKYNGDILKVTDFCRAMIVVQDIPALLALLELARESFGRWIRRVKMSTLKADYHPKAGGYRDCIINVELRSHICEIQVHLFPMWRICGVDGFRHYRHCLEYSTDSFADEFDALDGVDRNTMAELIVVAEEAVAETPLEHLEWYHEKYIVNYFAEAGLFLKHKLWVWAEVTLRQLIRLRTESPDIGPQHEETIILNRHLITALEAQNKRKEAAQIRQRVDLYEKVRARNGDLADREFVSVWDSFLDASSDVYDIVIDPNRQEREKELETRKMVKKSKLAWRQIRAERFPFLEAIQTEGRRISFRNSMFTDS